MMRGDGVSNAANQDEASCKKSMTKSTSSVAPVSNAQVNSRIQQMIAMQKSQNATMRQLMSTGNGMSSASPSGLRDLVKLPVRYFPPSQASGSASDTDPPAAVTMEPMQPPPSEPKLPTQNQIPPQTVAGIHFQGPQTIRPPHTSIQQVFSSPVLTPPHLHPTMPNYGTLGENDSPVSYNSVLDQNFTPSNAPGQIRTQQQQQVNQSQPPLVEMHDGTSNFHRNEQQSPVPHPESTNTTVVREYSLNLLGQHPAHNTNADKNPIVIGPVSNLQLDRQPVVQLQREIKPETLASDAHGRGVEAISPLMTHTHHEFHYGSNVGGMGAPHSMNASDPRRYNQVGGEVCLPNSPLDQDLNFNASSRLLQLRTHRRRRGILLAILCYPFQCLFPSEQLCRSFCFGAIDGMLTGAGILSACVGLGLVSQIISSVEESTSVKWIPIALTLSATFSDAICMAIGHVWSTHLDAGAAYAERKEELHNFQICRSDAKARLVDTLLMNGMLKIDAMCIADTLEGYPDMFVSALIGGGIGGLDSGDDGLGRAPRENAPLRQTEPSTSYGTGVAAQHSFKYESYSGSSDFCDDPDQKALSETLAASRLEGFFMMLSFSSFSVIPGLIYLLLSSMIHDAVYPGDRDNLVGLLTLGLTAGVMFVLGGWKSCFYSSGWSLFGLKNTGVLLVCVATAYSFGSLCSILIGS